MAAAIGWYGPLIDLSKASSHVDDLVQLLVLVRHSQPVQKVIAYNRRPVLMTKIQVGDDMRPYFELSVWQKYIGTMIVSGDVILLQNVRIVKFREVLEASTLQISLLTVLAHSSNLMASKDNVQLIARLQLGSIAREKFCRVIYWIQHKESTMHHVRRIDKGEMQNKAQVPKNWKSFKDQKPATCLSITDVICLKSSCAIIFHAFIGEIFFPPYSRSYEVEEQFFLREALLQTDKRRYTEELICVGCTTCGFPMDSRLPLYCSKSSKYVHDINQIYRPFLLHVWDQTGLLPLLVKNKAATILFGQLTAEKVYTCFIQKSVNKNSSFLHHGEFCSSSSSNLAGHDHLNSANGDRNRPDFHSIWLILVKVLLKQQESPFLFEVDVDDEKDVENGRFEMISLRMPCCTGEGK